MVCEGGEKTVQLNEYIIIITNKKASHFLTRKATLTSQVTLGADWTTSNGNNNVKTSSSNQYLPQIYHRLLIKQSQTARIRRSMYLFSCWSAYIVYIFRYCYSLENHRHYHHIIIFFLVISKSNIMCKKPHLTKLRK